MTGTLLTQPVIRAVDASGLPTGGRAYCNSTRQERHHADLGVFDRRVWNTPLGESSGNGRLEAVCSRRSIWTRR